MSDVLHSKLLGGVCMFGSVAIKNFNVSLFIRNAIKSVDNIFNFLYFVSNLNCHRLYGSQKNCKPFWTV